MTGGEPLLRLSAVIARPLAGVDVTLGVGAHVVLGRPVDGSAELVNLCAGVTTPQSGVVRIAGNDPYRSPETRARLGILLADEQLPPAASVVGALAWALHGRADARALLVEAGLASWAERSTQTLGIEERRTLALLVALGLPDARFLALYEPLTTALDRSWVLEHLTSLAARACVLSVTSSVRDASLLATNVLLLQEGRFSRRPGLPLPIELVPGGTAALLVHASDARRLATRVATDAAVVAVRWDERQGTRQLVVQGDDWRAVALAVARAAASEGISVSALSPEPPALEAAHSATWALARAAYDNAYRSGVSQAGQ